MTESLKLGGIDERDSPRIRRLNRVPIIVSTGTEFSALVGI